MQKNVDLKNVHTGVRLTHDEKVDSEYGALCARTRRRQKQAKADLRARGIGPRVRIGALYVAPSIARQFVRCNVGSGR